MTDNDWFTNPSNACVHVNSFVYESIVDGGMKKLVDGTERLISRVNNVVL